MVKAHFHHNVDGIDNKEKLNYDNDDYSKDHNCAGGDGTNDHNVDDNIRFIVY